MGDWDPDKKFTQPECQGGWLVCPPVLRFQQVGVGCLTFQNRLSLTIQIHPNLTTDPNVPRTWLQDWIKEIEMDVVSILKAVPEVRAGNWPRVTEAPRNQVLVNCRTKR